MKKITKSELQEQTRKDTALFDKLPNNVKNALVSELKKFWPKAEKKWPEKFSYRQRQLFGPPSPTDESR